jgi:hypothetical protein
MRKRIAWACWLFGTMAATGFVTLQLKSTNREIFLPGRTTAGHYQIELACDSCHTPYRGVQQDACLKCHEEELRVAEDSHPAAKFIDPRNAERVAKLDARLCIACHLEHRPEMTTTMGVTLQKDNCFYCHSDIAKERPSHEGMAFSTCESSGCHNFHDNRALYEEFLNKHRAQPRCPAWRSSQAASGGSGHSATVSRRQSRCAAHGEVRSAFVRGVGPIPLMPAAA